MAEYIDREAGIKVIQNIINHYHETYVSNARAETAEWCLKKLKVLPAAVVVEVRHGHWVEWNDGEGDTFECSVCGEPWTLNAGTPEENNMHHCPNCGAKMDEGWGRER